MPSSLPPPLFPLSKKHLKRELDKNAHTFTTKTTESLKALAHHGGTADTSPSILTAHAPTGVVLAYHHLHVEGSLSPRKIAGEIIFRNVIQFTRFGRCKVIDAKALWL